VAHTAASLLLTVLCLSGTGFTAATAAETNDNRPVIALIIDDLGNQRGSGSRAVDLPGPVACSFFPYGPYTAELAARAHARNKEVMLHLPMQPAGPYQEKREAGELTVDMTRSQYRDTFVRDLAAVPFVSGFNNHMGSLLTRHPGNMAWLMQVASETGKLFFIDSRTTTATVARQIAGEYGIPNSERNVFLDDVSTPDAIRFQFRRLLGIARRDGSALAISHPYPATLNVLTEELPQLERSGYRLVGVSELIEQQKTGSNYGNRTRPAGPGL
jgi:polysaccharide deacetylase 2 family uncharacterized protein YibQ